MHSALLCLPRAIMQPIWQSLSGPNSNTVTAWGRRSRKGICAATHSQLSAGHRAQVEGMQQRSALLACILEQSLGMLGACKR